MALYDLFAKSCGKPLYKVLGGNKSEIETDITISVNTVEEMVADSVKAVEQGFGILKIKVGKESLKDIERIKAIRQAVGPDVKLRIDANQGWAPKDAVRIIFCALPVAIFVISIICAYKANMGRNRFNFIKEELAKRVRTVT